MNMDAITMTLPTTALHQEKNVDDDGIGESYYSVVPTAVRSVAFEYQQLLPETRDIFWNDDFFDDEDVIAVFDFDYDKMITFQTPLEFVSQMTTVGCVALYAALLFWPVGPLIVLAMYGFSLAPFYLKSNVRWRAEAHHVAITRDGIRFVQDRRKAWWGFSICDKGKQSKTVPYDKITDCDILEPAGNVLCFFVPRILYTVHVDTASSGSESNRHELEITGLKDPHGFKTLVWAMKRNLHHLPLLPPPALSSSSSRPVYQPPKPTASSASQLIELSDLAQLTKAPSTSSESSSGGVRGLLRDIREELRQNNHLLRNLQQQQQQQKECGEPKGKSAPEGVVGPTAGAMV